jgi:hypothetical protein
VGRGSFGYLVAQLAVETGIAPQYLLDLDIEMFKNMLKVIHDRNKEMQNANRARRGRTASRST